jgi:glutaminase
MGDTDISFTFQSTAKPLLFDVAKETCGASMVNESIGHEPSGQRFNAFVLDEDGHPHNPLINSGAIMSSALIRSQFSNQVDAFKAVKSFAERTCGHLAPISFDNAVYLSELTTASRNFALTYFMREKNPFLRTVAIEDALALYFSACSMTITCKGLAGVAATYAFGGTCPVTRERVLPTKTAVEACQLMYSCGMYDYSGRWAFEVGIPAKSGVSGALMLSVPGRFGMAVWSPPLDKHGNTVRGTWLAKKLVERFRDLHIFDAALRRNMMASLSQEALLSNANSQLLIHACSAGNLELVERLVAHEGLSVNESDYDGRTPLHLAFAEGQRDVAEWLLAHGADPECKDRFGSTPRSEAAKTGLSDLLPNAPPPIVLATSGIQNATTSPWLSPDVSAIRKNAAGAESHANGIE